jgi:mitochondrial ATPase complex subunit ATP10
MMINAMRSETASSNNAHMPVRHVLYFGDIATATKVLGMSNRLTCYAFVLDSEGRVRWRNSGCMLADEGDVMVQAITALIQHA